MSRICVVGTGYVGLVSGACLADFGNHVQCVDIDADKITRLRDGKIPIYEPGLEAVVSRNVSAGRLTFSTSIGDGVAANEVVFIAVGTPPTEDGSADLSHVESVSRSIGRTISDYRVVVDKSTVPVGTARRVMAWIAEELSARRTTIPFDVVSNPEFLREGSAVQDFTHPDRVVLGSNSVRARDVMKEVYRALFLNETPFIETGLEAAELIKYAANAYLAMKVAFINEVADLCEQVGANVQDVARALGKDGRIGSKFLHPGPGYGGSCFPKDTRAMARTGQDFGLPLTLVEATIAANERRKARMVEKISSAMGDVSGRTIAVLGLSFKPNTDDMRESPAIPVCQGLAARGAKLRVYDPAAMKEAAWRLERVKDVLHLAADEYDCMNGSDAVVILTEWNQFRNLDLVRARSVVKGDFFFDLRNIYKPQEVESSGFHYFGVGQGRT